MLGLYITIQSSIHIDEDVTNDVMVMTLMNMSLMTAMRRKWVMTRMRHMGRQHWRAVLMMVWDRT